MAIEQAKKYIIHDQYEDANKIVYDTMSQTIKQKIFNEKSIELLPAYFILAEANIGMGGAKLKKAEEFLIAANWNLLKSGQSGGGDDGRAGAEDTTVTREELERFTASLNITFGRLFMAQNRPNAHEKALDKLTRGIYQECVEYGPESIYVCPSYFYMGQLFQQSRQLVNAKAFFQKIIQIWRNFIIENDLTVAEYNQVEIPLILYDEAEKHLTIILNWFREELGGYDNACAECLFTESLVAYKQGKVAEALDGMRTALQDYQNNLGIYDRKTQEVERVIQKIEEQYAHHQE